MQKIRLVIRGWNRRREEKEREFLARNTWGAPVTPSISEGPGRVGGAIDLDGLTVAYLDDSGQFQHYLDIETGEVIDTRDSMSGDRYRRVPVQSGIEDRREFIASLDASRTRDRLTACIGMGEAFRRALADDRNIERAWYNFKNDRAIAGIERWLREIGLR